MAILFTINEGDIGAIISLIFYSPDGSKVDLTGYSISGVMQDQTATIKAITGTLTPDADQTSNPGVFTWALATGDSSAAGQWLCTFSATSGGNTRVYQGMAVIKSPTGDNQFTTDLDTDTGKVRLNIGDTNYGSGPRPGNHNYTDRQIEYFLTESNTVTGACIHALFTLSAEWARYAVDEQLDESIRFNARDVSSQYHKRAEAMRENPIGSHDRGRWGTMRLGREDAWDGMDDF